MRNSWIGSAAVAGLMACLYGNAAMAQDAGCDTPQSHQFDFWVGKWTVTPNGHPDRHVANSLIEKLYQGCAVRENWAPLKGGPGGSLSAYAGADHHWRQAWVDSSGAFAAFTGGWNGKAMVLEGVWPQPGHPRQITRMTYTPAPGAVVATALRAWPAAPCAWVAGSRRRARPGPPPSVRARRRGGFPARAPRHPPWVWR